MAGSATSTATMEVFPTAAASLTNPSSGDDDIHSTGAGASLLCLCLLNITGNILLLIALWKLRKSNRKLHPVDITIGMFACTELIFGIVPEAVFVIAFLSSTWRLENFAVWCNLTGWVAMFSKLTGACITLLLIMERYVGVACLATGSSRRRTSTCTCTCKNFAKSLMYWAIRAIMLVCFLATMPLFYGSNMVSTAYTRGDYCRFDYMYTSSMYALILCVVGFIILQVVLFCFVSILCHQAHPTHNHRRHNDSYQEELIHSNSVSVSVSSSTNHAYDRYFIEMPTPTRQMSRESSNTPSRFALDHPSFFETMKNDAAKTRNTKHRTRMVLALVAWYWACLLPYMVSQQRNSDLSLAWLIIRALMKYIPSQFQTSETGKVKNRSSFPVLCLARINYTQKTRTRPCPKSGKSRTALVI